MMIEIVPIGVIRSPYRGKGDAPRQGAGTPGVSTVEVYPEYAPAMGSMEGISHIWVLYWMHQAERHLLTVRRPEWSEERPVFTVRSPARPNPIALSIGRIQFVEGPVITVTGLEALDGSFVIDIKPYIRTRLHTGTGMKDPHSFRSPIPGMNQGDLPDTASSKKLLDSPL